MEELVAADEYQSHNHIFFAKNILTKRKLSFSYCLFAFLYLHVGALHRRHNQKKINN